MRVSIIFGFVTKTPFPLPYLDRTPNGIALFWLWFDVSIYWST